MATTWLLDFDDVLNGNRCGWHSAPRRTSILVDGANYKIRWSPNAVVAIRTLYAGGPANGGLNIRWATSWIDVPADLTRIENLLGLPAFPHAYPADPDRYRARTHGDGGFKAQHTAAKTAAALAALDRGDRLIWTDDDAIPADGPARDRLDAAGALLIAPTGGRGLRPEHLDAIRAYVGAPAATPAP